MTEFEQKLGRTRAYLDYLEQHYRNVQKAFEIIKEACKDQPIMYDDFRYFSLLDELKDHDLSKLSAEEFIQYRRRFFPTVAEASERQQIEESFESAWEHHKEGNDHHHETWTARKYSHPYAREIHGYHMLCDWVAMSLTYGEVSPREYYEKNKDEMSLPGWVVAELMAVCEHMEAADNKELC